MEGYHNFEITLILAFRLTKAYIFLVKPNWVYTGLTKIIELKIKIKPIHSTFYLDFLASLAGDTLCSIFNLDTQNVKNLPKIRQNGYAVYASIGNGTKSTYTYDRQGERLQGMH